MHMPVTKRRMGTIGPGGSTARIIALAIAATRAETMKNRRGSIRSARLRIALIRLPVTNPAWTPLVMSAWLKFDSLYSATSAGTIADAENHSAIAATWQSAISAI